MASYTTSLRLVQPATGEFSGTWGTQVNNGLTALVDASVAGTATIVMTAADYTLSTANGATDEARAAILNVTGTPGAARNIIVPALSKLYVVFNNTTGGFAQTVKTSAGTGISVPNGATAYLRCDGTNVVAALNYFGSLTLGAALPVTSGGTGVTTSTGSGNNVLSTSPTLVTPVLGTPTSVTLTNATGLPLTTGVTGTLPVANGGTGVTSSTGSGSNVLSISPTLVTPVLGTPTSVTLTNATGLPLSTGVTGTLGVANGGTGATSLTANNVLLGNGTSAVQVVAPGTSGNVLTSNGTTWVSQAATSGLSGQTDSATPFETSLGYQAGNVSTGINNTFVGYQAGLVNSSGTHNTALGWTALDANTTGGQNTAIGAGALSAASTLIGNVGVGSLALSSLTTLSSYNTAVGWEAGKSYSPSSGVVGGLTAVGASAAGSTTTGTGNTAVGSFALTTNTTQNSNTAIGFESLYLNAGSANTAVGTSTMRQATAANNNTAVGNNALFSLSTGGENTAIGEGAAQTLTTGSNNTVIGRNAAPSSNTVSNEITLGNSSITSFRIPGLSVTWGVNTVPYRNIPPVGTKTSSYTLAVADVGKYVQVGASGSIVIPDATFAEGDVVSVFNNTSGSITITCSITTAYISGIDSDKATVSLATRGVATILFISGTVCVISGAVS